MKSDAAGYLKSWSDELNARSKRVRKLIGDAHWLSDGKHKEELIIEFIKRYLSANLVASNGFIKNPSDSEMCSPEIDILITDPGRHPPFMNEGALRIVSPSSVVAFLEVKSSFDSKSIKDSLGKISRSTECSCYGEDVSGRIWSGIIFFETDRGLESVCKTLEDCLVEMLKSGEFKYLPKCIAVLSGHVIFPMRVGSKVVLKAFNAGDLSAAFAFIDMFSFISANGHGSGGSEFEDMVDGCGFSGPLIREFAVEG